MNGVPFRALASASAMGGDLSAREQAERDALKKEYTADNEASTVVAKATKKSKATNQTEPTT